jgi:multidrug efflux pump subunit AcrA (membrane-fusion protein)
MPEPEEPKVEPQAVTTPAPETETVDGEPFDAARAMKTIEKLRAEIKELKPKAKQADELTVAEQKRKEAEMTELQKMQAQLEKAQADLKAAKLAELKRQAATEVELPLVFADRLIGETLDDLKEDAKKILAVLPKAPKPPKVEATNPGPGASTGETLAERRARVYGQGPNVMSDQYALEHGGGVVIKEKHLTKE